jgi:hypothetical protein
MGARKETDMSETKLTGWQPIESAPKDGTYVLVTNGVAQASWVAKFVGERAFIENPWMSMMLNLWHSPVRYFSTIPTHWMPLPAPPALSNPESE